MDDQSDDLRRTPARRVEVYDGSGRRRWSEELKAQIVADSISPGAVVTQVARRYGCRPQQVHEWRAKARAGKLILPTTANAQVLVPLGLTRRQLRQPPPSPSTSRKPVCG